MGSMIAQEMHLENGEGSLLIPPLKYKRRKVSAVRDFPPGCGPNATRYRTLATADGLEGPKEGVALKDVEVFEKGGGCSEADGNGLLEVLVEGQGRDVPMSQSGVQLDVSRTDELQMLSIGNTDTLQDIKTVEERLLLKGENHDPSDLKEQADVIKNESIVEGTTAQQHLLPHYPVPSTTVGKEQKYPPRRRVSAVRDFPTGCGSNVLRSSQVEDKHVVQGETHSNMHEVSMLNQIEGQLDGYSVLEDEIQGANPGKRKISGVNEGAAARMLVQEIFFEIKEQEKISDDNKDDQCVKVMEQSGSGGGSDGKDMETSLEELDKDLIVYGRDSRKKSKLSAGVPRRNIELQGEFGVGSGTFNRVVVQGLMCAAFCPWRRIKGLGISSPFRVTANESKGKKNGSNGRGKSKLSLNFGKRIAERSSEKSMMIVPYTKETEMEMDTEVNGVCTPLAVRYTEDSSESEELHDFKFLPRKGECDITLPPSFACSSSERGARSKVRETLRLFQAVVRKLLQGEETKSKKGKAVKRIDTSAANVLKDKGRYINTVKAIGAVPGVEVGDIFSYRVELAIIGVHGPLQSGIDTIKLGKKSVAVSVVASGGYDNGIDSSDVLIYTGQGGNPAGPDKQPEDQKLERGNLALKNCIDEKTPVRVIRGFKEAKPADSADARPKMIATYTYDGLYSVEKYWHDLGPHGKLVYKFELRRIPGQRELAWKEVKQSRKFKARLGRCVDDISQGREKLPVCAVNTVDDEQPPQFTYITTMMYPDWCRPIPLKGCNCKYKCSDSERCACAVKNGGEIPYNLSGSIVEAKSLVYECGPSCKCPPSCPNRVSQHGIKLPLEIFKTESMGWGVRCLSSISSGSFICQYLGELLDDKEAEKRTGSDEYLFDIGQNYNDPTLTDGLSAVIPNMASTASDIVENIGFTIDAANFGNIGRFINHSCSPNLYAQNVLFDHEDKRIPHIMLFAAENIPPLQELTYHYNYTIDQVFAAQGKIKRKDCYCGSAECTGRMY